MAEEQKTSERVDIGIAESIPASRAVSRDGRIRLSGIVGYRSSQLRVADAAFSPDGRFVALLSGTGRRLSIHDARTMYELRHWSMGDEPCLDVHWGSSGDLLLLSTHSGTLTARSVREGQQAWSLASPAELPWARIVPNPVQPIVAYVTPGKLQLVDSRAGRVLWVQEADADDGSYCAWLGDGESRLLVISRGRELLLLDPRRHGMILGRTQVMRRTRAMAALGSRLALVTEDGRLHEMELVKGALVMQSSRTGFGTVFGLLYSPNGGRILAIGDDSLRVLAAESLETISALDESPGLTWTSTGRRVLLGTADDRLQLWEWSTNVKEGLLPSPSAGDVRDIACLGPSSVAVSESSRGALVYEVSSGRSTWVGRRSASPAVALCAVGPARLAFVDDANDLHLWTRGAGATSYVTPIGRTVYCIAFDQEGRRVVIGGTGGYLGLHSIDGPTREPTVLLRGHVGAVLAAAVDVRSRHLASGGADGVVRVWNLGAAERPPTTLEHGAVVRCVSWSATEGLLACGTDDGRVRVWDCETWRLVANKPLHEGRVLALTCLEDKLVSIGQDRELRVVRFRDLAPWASMSLDFAARSVAPDDAALWVGGSDGNVRRYLLQE